MIMYRSHFRGWVQVTEQQKEKLINHMQKGITAMKKDVKEEYIKSRFKTV